MPDYRFKAIFSSESKRDRFSFTLSLSFEDYHSRKREAYWNHLSSLGISPGHPIVVLDWPEDIPEVEAVLHSRTGKLPVSGVFDPYASPLISYSRETIAGHEIYWQEFSRVVKYYAISDEARKLSLM